MQQSRIVDLSRLTSERVILQKHAQDAREFSTEVPTIRGTRTYPNEVGEEKLGLFRPVTARKAVIADMDMLHNFEQKSLKIPSFLEAGPRAELRHNPHSVRAAIVTTGGLAPGLHCVIHSIVKRHNTYSLTREQGKVLGVYDSFRGLCNFAYSHVELDSATTEAWLDEGGSKLGVVRYFHGNKKDKAAITEMVNEISRNLENNHINILYVIGGDGSLRIAHKLAEANPERSIVGIPKTMDNDVLWVWQSFGFDTAVEQATRVINTLRTEAEAARRICLIELFGADSGFVAANASLASGHVDLVLIPEVFKLLSEGRALAYLDECVSHIRDIVQQEPHNPHAVVVVAEGVGAALEQKGVRLGKTIVQKDTFMSQFTNLLKNRIVDAHHREVPVFLVQPRYLIRAVPANPHDQIYCERLGALAVDNALAGYTDFMISRWLTEFVLVPMHLAESGKKSIPVNGMFWKQVVSSTRQPLSPAEYPSAETAIM